MEAATASRSAVELDHGELLALTELGRQARRFDPHAKPSHSAQLDLVSALSLPSSRSVAELLCRMRCFAVRAESTRLPANSSMREVWRGPTRGVWSEQHAACQRLMKSMSTLQVERRAFSTEMAPPEASFCPAFCHRFRPALFASALVRRTHRASHTTPGGKTEQVLKSCMAMVTWASYMSDRGVGKISM